MNSEKQEQNFEKIRTTDRNFEKIFREAQRLIRFTCTVWLVSKCTGDVKNQENIGMRHINVPPMTSRTRIRTVWLHTFSWSGVIEVTILEVHLRDQMTLLRESMRGLVPKTKCDSIDPWSHDDFLSFAPYERRSFERTEKNWKAKLNRHTVDPCPGVPKKKLQKIPKTE